MPPRVVTLLTDFGLADDFAGTCRGVIKRIAPAVDVIDITHGIAPYDVLQGALVLANTLPYMPVGVHIAVVDPGVGGPRRPLGVQGRDGRLYVGPDNGLLLLAADRLGGVAEAVAVENSAYLLEPVAQTFHGRDVFAPAAAQHAVGVPLVELGPALDPETLTRLELPRPAIAPGRIRANVLLVDRFGNAQLNLTAADLERAGIARGETMEVQAAGKRRRAVAARTFADARPGELILYEDAYWNLALAISRGSAAVALSLAVGSEVALERPGR